MKWIAEESGIKFGEVEAPTKCKALTLAINKYKKEKNSNHPRAFLALFIAVKVKDRGTPGPKRFNYLDMLKKGGS